MEVNCIFAPTLETPDHIALAEQLGYERAWVYDVPIAWADTGITVATAAKLTSTIRLGVSVFTPHLRHLTMNAALIAHLATVAPGRFDAGVGAGFTSAAFLARKPARWADIEHYVIALRTLLAGKEVEWDGVLLSLMHTPLTGIGYPIEVPIWIGAHGPRGYACAQRLGAGVVTGVRPLPDGESSIHGANVVPVDGPCQLTYAGTILDEGEALDSPRVIEAAGPGASIALHLGEYGPLAGLAQTKEHAEEIAAIDESRRHLELHRGHLTEPNAIDRRHLDAEVIRLGSMSGSRWEVAARLRQLEDAGAPAVMYQPAGPDIARELRAFREAAESRHDVAVPTSGVSTPSKDAPRG